MSKQNQNKTPVADEIADEIASAYKPGTAQTVDETHPAVVAAAEPEAAAVVVEEAKIGEPVDLAAADDDMDGDMLGGTATLSDAEVAEAMAANATTTVTVVDGITAVGGHDPDAPEADAPLDPEDVIRATREYGDLLERGYQPGEALAELKARTPDGAA